MAIPRYREIEAIIRSAITSGQYPIGSLLPTEGELCQLYGVSRHTIREAIKRLAVDGLVSRKKHVGTRVKSVGNRYRQTLASINDLVHFAEQHKRRVVSVTPVEINEAQAANFEIAPHSHWISIETLRVEQGAAADRPVCWTNVLLGSCFSGIEEQIQTQSTRLISDILSDHFHQHTVAIAQSIDVSHLDEQVAELLHAKPGDAVLDVVRQYRGTDGQVLLVSRTLSLPGQLTIQSLLTNTSVE